MLRLVVPLLGFLVAAPALAFSPSLSVPDAPYTPITLEADGELQQEHLGRLEGYPVLYEITSEEPFTLSAVIRQLRQGGEPRPFSLIAIRQNDRGGGVTEVARLPAGTGEWVREKDSAIGMTFWRKEALTAEVESGTYRIEVSTPNNEGPYWISFGTAADEGGYFETLGGVYRTQQFFDRSMVSMLLSSYVYYPLGILLLLVLFERTWRYRKHIIDRA